jgi:hypothetical protein
MPQLSGQMAQTVQELVSGPSRADKSLHRQKLHRRREGRFLNHTSLEGGWCAAAARCRYLSHRETWKKI